MMSPPSRAPATRGRRGALAGGALGALSTAIAWTGCATSVDSFVAPIPDGGSDATSTDGGPTLLGDSTGDVPANCTSCSADLHSVLDCANPPHQIIACPPEQGCGSNGQCVAPCAAAGDNKSSIGCDYYAIPADGWSDIPINPGASLGASDGSCFAAFVVNNWGTPMKANLEYDGVVIDASPFAYLPHGSGAALTYEPIPPTGIPAGAVAIVFLSQYGDVPDGDSYKALCPSSVHAAFTTTDIGLHGTGVGHAVHLTTSVPATVYDIYPFGGATSFIASATLLLPTDAWDVNYVAVTAWPGEPPTGPNGVPSDVGIVAMHDGTTIQLLPTAAIQGGGPVPYSDANQTATFTLNRGELLQLSQLEDLSGSPIKASAPVGVWGGHYCMDVPDMTVAACDAAHQQIPPVKAAGSEYVAVRYRSRTGADEIVPWRIMGMVSGTTLTYDPPQPNAPVALNAGSLIEFDSAGPFVVRSQDVHHPFYLAAHMTGGATAGGLGDPETVNVTPPLQYLQKYVFFTDPTYAETNLVLVQGKDATGAYPPVTLDCIGTPLGNWSAIGGSDYQYVRVDLQHQHMPVDGCDNGAHTISSTAPFGVTVWGFDQYVSYAYPAGASVHPINDVVVDTMQQ